MLSEEMSYVKHKDLVLVEELSWYDGPVIMVMRHGFHHYYFHLYNRDHGFEGWFIAPVSLQDVQDLKACRVTPREILTRGLLLKGVEFVSEDKILLGKATLEFDKDSLPKEGTYLYPARGARKE